MRAYSRTVRQSQPTKQKREGIPTHAAAFGILPEARWAYRTAAGSTSNFQNLSGWK